MNETAASKVIEHTHPVVSFPIPRLTSAELKAWRLWRPSDSVRDVLVMRRQSGKYPLIQGGVA